MTKPNAAGRSGRQLPPRPGATAEQEIRAEALYAAVHLLPDTTNVGESGDEGLLVRDVEQSVIGTAERFAAWIATGSTEAWDR